MFTRTNSGISNLRHFKGVDLVVFCEGGLSDVVSIQEALSGRYDAPSNDKEFWRPIFGRLRTDLSVSFRATGTKDTLKKMATELASGRISGICVVMDRDFDDLFGEVVSHHRVLYTHKYSWESEVFETRVILRAFQTFALSEISERRLEEEIRPIVAKLRRDLRHLIRADAILCAAGKPLFRRKRPVSALNDRGKFRKPSLNCDSIRSRLRTYRSEIKGYYLVRPLGQVDVKRHCFGKLFLAAGIQTLQYLAEWCGQPPLRNEYSTRFLIRGVHAWFAERPGSAPAKYYARVLARV